jgi:type VI secretion system protein ImpH
MKNDLHLAKDDGDQESGFPSIHSADTGLQFEAGPNHDARLAEAVLAVEQKRNPFLEAASVLLRSLAELPKELVSTLARFFGVLVQLREYMLQWMPIEPQDHCILGQPRPSSVLGEGAMLGEVVPDRQSRFRLLIGPLDMEGYLRLTPQGSASGKDLPALRDIVRSFVGFEYVWEVELLIRSEAAPQTRLGDSTQLGWSSWMASAPPGSSASRTVTGMVFEPESYSA